MQDNTGALRRRREDEASPDFTAYVEDVITRLDRVIQRLMEDADVLRNAAPHPGADASAKPPAEEPPAIMIR